MLCFFFCCVFSGLFFRGVKILGAASGAVVARALGHQHHLALPRGLSVHSLRVLCAATQSHRVARANRRRRRAAGLRARQRWPCSGSACRVVGSTRPQERRSAAATRARWRGGQRVNFAATRATGASSNSPFGPPKSGLENTEKQENRRGREIKRKIAGNDK